MPGRVPAPSFPGVSTSVRPLPQVRISVKDSGAGLSKANLKLLFTEGTQFNANKLQGGGGSGLGLFITKVRADPEPLFRLASSFHRPPPPYALPCPVPSPDSLPRLSGHCGTARRGQDLVR